MKKSRIPEFYKLSRAERLKIVKDFAGLSDEATAILGNTASLGDLADLMVENVVGTMPLPIGIAMNFLINGKDYLIPMATEESSVIAAASNAAKMARTAGSNAGAGFGFQTSSTEPVMIGQIQLMNVPDPSSTKFTILANKEQILEIANRKKDSVLVNLGGGAKDIEVRVIDVVQGSGFKVQG